MFQNGKSHANRHYTKYWNWIRWQTHMFVRYCWKSIYSRYVKRSYLLCLGTSFWLRINSSFLRQAFHITHLLLNAFDVVIRCGFVVGICYYFPVHICCSEFESYLFVWFVYTITTTQLLVINVDDVQCKFTICWGYPVIITPHSWRRESILRMYFFSISFSFSLLPLPRLVCRFCSLLRSSSHWLNRALFIDWLCVYYKLWIIHKRRITIKLFYLYRFIYLFSTISGYIVSGFPKWIHLNMCTYYNIVLSTRIFGFILVGLTYILDVLNIFACWLVCVSSILFTFCCLPK